MTSLFLYNCDSCKRKFFNVSVYSIINKKEDSFLYCFYPQFELIPEYSITPLLCSQCGYQINYSPVIHSDLLCNEVIDWDEFEEDLDEQKQKKEYREVISVLEKGYEIIRKRELNVNRILDELALIARNINNKRKTEK